MPFLTEVDDVALRKLFAAKGDLVEAVLVETLERAGVPGARARAAASACSHRVWMGMGIGGAVGVVINAAHPLAALAGGTVGAIGGGALAALSCEPTRRELIDAVDELLSGRN
jgi:hypothetical protein